MNRPVDAMRRLLRRTGFDIYRYNPATSPRLRRAYLMRRVVPALILDVGANEGDYGLAIRRDGFRGRILSIEPLPGPFARLKARAAKDPRWECLQVAASDVNGRATINVAGNSYSSSLLPMLPRHVDSAPESAYVALEDVETATLDSLRALHFPFANGVWLKLDVQGFEARVLGGAAETLHTVSAIELELSTVPLYEGQPLLCDMMEALNGKGFVLYAIDQGFNDPRTGRILQVDGIFLRE